MEDQPPNSYANQFHLPSSGEYLKSYSFGIMSVPNIERNYVQCSSTTSIKPPLIRKPLGRPKAKCIKSAGEVSSKKRTCGRYST